MKAKKSIDISAPPERVWPFFVEPEKVLQWFFTYKKFEYTGDQRSGVGTPVYVEEQSGGPLMTIHFEATEWRENEKLVWQMAAGTGVKFYRQALALEAIPTGSRFTFIEDVELPWGLFGKLIGYIGEPMSNASVEKMLLKLKTLVEA